MGTRLKISHLPAFLVDCSIPFRLTWVHGDEDTTGGLEVDLPALKGKPLCLVGEGLQDGEDLLCHHREHFNVDTVELIETAPSTSLDGQR